VSRDVGAAIALALGVELADLALDLDLDHVTGARLAERLVEGGFAPPPPIAAIGRDVERAWLRERFGASGSVCIVGPPGAGKSALAADLVASMPGTGPVCWLDGARIERSDPVTVLFALASCLGLSERLPNANLVPLDALARAFRKALWRLCPTLVLDDVSALDSITLLADLDLAPRLVVTTSSRAVARGLAVPCLELGPLSTADALDILAMSARPSSIDAGAPLDAAELEAAHELIALVGRSPRVLRVVGHQLARDAFSRLPDYLDRLKGALAARPESPRAHAATIDLEPAFLATWLGLDRRLPQSALEALGALAIFERRRVPLAWALAAIGGEPSEARASLSRLHDLHLVTRLGPDTLGLDADAQRIARTLPAGPALDRLVAFATPRLDVAARSPAELSLCMLLFDASCGALFPNDAIAPATFSPERPPPLDPARRPHASLLVALGLPLLPALVQDHAPVAGRRLAALARATSSVAAESFADVAGALGTWLLTCAGQPHAALPWLERAIALSAARGDLRSAGRFAAQRAPAGYYLGDPEQGLGDIRRAISFADAAGDVDAACASSLMHAIGVAHMRDTWPEAMAELRACTTPVDSAHGAVLAALARVDLAVCELALGLPISHPDALGPACDTLAHAAQGSPFDAAGVDALAIVLGVRARPGSTPPRSSRPCSRRSTTPTSRAPCCAWTSWPTRSRLTSSRRPRAPPSRHGAAPRPSRSCPARRCKWRSRIISP